MATDIYKIKLRYEINTNNVTISKLKTILNKTIKGAKVITETTKVATTKVATTKAATTKAATTKAATTKDATTKAATTKAATTKDATTKDATTKAATTKAATTKAATTKAATTKATRKSYHCAYGNCWGYDGDCSVNFDNSNIKWVPKVRQKTNELEKITNDCWKEIL